MWLKLIEKNHETQYKKARERLRGHFAFFGFFFTDKEWEYFCSPECQEKIADTFRQCGVTAQEAVDALSQISKVYLNLDQNEDE